MNPADLAYLYSLTNEYRSVRYDLRNMQALAAALGNPQNSFRSVLIAGTNGKGSVARLLSAMMADAGLYTSPHLVRLNERIEIGNREISNEDLEAVFNLVRDTAANMRGLLYRPTYFELVTAMAFCHFRGRVRFAVLEVGLGGRLDATNIVCQEVSVITSIGIDHQRFLGSTLEAISREKAGVIKDREPVVVGPGADLPVIRRRAGDRLIRTSRFERRVRSLGRGHFEVDLRTEAREYAGLRPKMAGRHQIDNVVTAICAAEQLGLSAGSIQSGVNAATLAGRLERFDGRSDGEPAFLLDGAHNTAAAQTLALFLEEFYPDGVWMIFGAMADKQVEEMIRVLQPHVRQMIFTKTGSPRSKEPAAMRRLVNKSRVEPTVGDAIQYARVHAPRNTTVVVCGSLYLIGEARLVLE